ncbi:molybdate ABC transporter substrate-binding protein [Maridesulfovibrio frigidus]|uniref:molybdate ABC transporter substrate-binding protein n=1 Tax=Maridesulfovibrio frigidus TaxID=340956 RepID=UPI0004E12270|nr:molybdate ABC transporter substrate-binding protein [Maridesulfovibrio frigidus]
MTLFKRVLLALLWICLTSQAVSAASLTVGCAANFTGAMKQLAVMYEKETGNEILCSFGSTGMLYGQITNGAPYDLFFAADEKRPDLLYTSGLAEKPLLYATGKAVLWSSDKGLAEALDWKEAVLSSKIEHVAISNPKTAPYGSAAQEALIKVGLLDKLTPKLVFGKSVGVAFQFAYSGSAEAGFIALSQALSGKGMEGKYWAIPEAGKVKQSVAIIKSGKVSESGAFLAWMKTPSVREVIKEYGYE